MPFFALFASMQSDEDVGPFDDLSEASMAESAETEPVPRDHPAYHRVPTHIEEASPSRGLNRRAVIGVLIITVSLLVVYVIVRSSAENVNDTPNLLELAAANAASVQLEILTDDLDEAEDYILGEFGWPIRVPILAESRVVGVGVDEITDGVELPVLQYATSNNGPITVYLYDYAFLDAAAGRLSLAPAVYARLAEDEGVDVRRVDDYYVILWRRRAVIYTAVTLQDPIPIAEGLRRGR